jgi:small subunit ribosomal protein S1
MSIDAKKDDSIDKPVKTVAVDTGKRIDVSEANRSTTVRRRSAIERHERRGSTMTKAAVEAVEEQESRPRPTIAVVEPERRVPLYVEPLEFDESGDFLSMLLESEGDEKSVSIKVGDKVTGKVVHIGKDIFVAIGPKVEASISASELSDADGNALVRVGQKITSYVVSTHGGITLSNNVAQSGLDLVMLEEACAKRIPVEGKVMAVNKGGFDIQVSGKRAFCPVGQIDLRFVEDTNSFVGKNLSFLIERIEEGGRNIVVSRRALLERERHDKAIELIKDIEVNKRYDAVITRIADFGAFADIGGIEGLIPRSELSHGHIERVLDVVSSGDRVEVVVLNFEPDQNNPSKSRLSFSLKKAKADPYALHWSKIAVGSTLEGRVVRIESFGAFVELFPGIDGLIHISELSENKVAHPKEILSVGDAVSVRVMSIDDEAKRIGLTLRESVTRKKPGVEVAHKLERGQKASGVVSRIERYGVFLELDNGVTALMPQSESGLPKGADLSRSFKIGDTVPVAVIDIDSQNRVRVSKAALEQMEERDSYLQFHTSENKKGASFGTFADLLRKKS